jgi:prophage regulatory protein
MSRILINYNDLLEKGVRYSRVQLRRKERDGTFPQRVRISDSRVGWYEDEIDAWIAALPRGFAVAKREQRELVAA